MLDLFLTINNTQWTTIGGWTHSQPLTVIISKRLTDMIFIVGTNNVGKKITVNKWGIEFKNIYFANCSAIGNMTNEGFPQISSG